MSWCTKINTKIFTALNIDQDQVTFANCALFVCQERDGEEPPKVLEALEKNAGIRGAQMFFKVSSMMFTAASIRASSCSASTATKT